MRFWVYFVRWFMANRLVLFCFVDKYRTNITKSMVTASKEEERDKSA